MSDLSWLPTFAAIAIALTAALASSYQFRYSVRRDEVSDLRRRMADIEEELKECHRDRDSLREENLALLQKLVS